ncbi:MAG: DUF4349 domain-containing protein [Propionicimonas sp.]|nr:DUF4349 domain-containing protein [Propionicimonas sp.]
MSMTVTRSRSGWLPALAAGLALLLLGGCSAGSAPASGGAGAPAQPSEVAMPDGGAPEAPTIPGNRQIARSATLELVVPDVDRAAGELRRIAGLVGGLVTSESLQLPTDAEQYYEPSVVVVTVPSGRLDESLTLMAGLGTVSRRTVESVDVTETLVDVDSRVKTLRESIARLQALMERAGSVSDIAAVESELTSRQAELESMLAQQKALRQQVASSPVTVTLETAATVATDPPAGFLAGLASGWGALANAAGIGLTILGALVPWLALAALVGLPLAWWRHRRRVRAPGDLPAPGTRPADARQPVAPE